MSTSEIAYFATAATVMPVLFLAYAIQLRNAAGTLQDIEQTVLSRISVKNALRSSSRDGRNRALSALLVVPIAVARLILSLAVLLPLAAEASCFIVLANGHKAPAGNVSVVAVGLGVAALPLLLPLVYYVVGITILDPIRETWELAKVASEGAEEGPETPD